MDSWNQIFNQKLLKECMEKVKEPCVPEKNLIFKCFEYFPPEKCRIIILGQDPYTEGAQGLSFSCEKLRVSVRRILNSVREHGYIEKMPETGNLHVWAERGVLLLNSMLTVGDKFWFDFIDDLLLRLMESNPNILLFAWGNDAQNRTLQLPQNRVKKFTHPASRTSVWHFSGFAEIPLDFVNIGSWTLHKFYRVYTDGSCIGNGRKNARGGWACAFHHGYSENSFLRMYGKLMETKLIYTNGKINILNEPVKATNNRAELFAIIFALTKILQLSGPCYVEIITDSEFAINVITNWMHKWHPHFEKKSNPDLVQSLYNLYFMHKKITFTHQKAHLDNPNTMDEKGNAVVDLLAKKGSDASDFKTHID